MNIKAIVALFIFFGLARCATRIGVYVDSTCVEGNLIGYYWYPGPNRFTETSCTRSTTERSGVAQYFDIKQGLAEVDHKTRPTDWHYLLVTTNQDIECDDFVKYNTTVYAAKPNTCINSGTDTKSSLQMSCENDEMQFISAADYGCNNSPTAVTNGCLDGSLRYVSQCAITAPFDTPKAPTASTSWILAPLPYLVGCALVSLFF